MSARALMLIMSLLFLCACESRKAPLNEKAGESARESRTVSSLEQSPGVARSGQGEKKSRSEPETGSPSGEVGDRTGPPALCRTICQRTSRLKCGPEQTCLQGCGQMLEVDKCAVEMRGFLRCIAAEPPAHFECDEQGVAAIKEGYCNTEQEKYTVCYNANGRVTR